MVPCFDRSKFYEVGQWSRCKRHNHEWPPAEASIADFGVSSLAQSSPCARNMDPGNPGKQCQTKHVLQQAHQVMACYIYVGGEKQLVFRTVLQVGLQTLGQLLARGCVFDPLKFLWSVVLGFKVKTQCIPMA